MPLDCCRSSAWACVPAEDLPGDTPVRPPGRAGHSEWLELIGMEVLYDRVAGLDIGKATLTACVRIPGTRRGTRHQETRTFKTTTGSLRVIRDWLLDQGVTIAAMESTSTYWKPAF